MAHNALKLEKYCHVEFLDKYGRDVKDKMLKSICWIGCSLQKKRFPANAFFLDFRA